MLRSIAVVTVIIDHLIPTLVYHGVHVPVTLRALTEYIGQAGVLAFFVHTSLVLMSSLERMQGSSTLGRLAARVYVRRFFRAPPLC